MDGEWFRNRHGKHAQGPLVFGDTNLSLGIRYIARLPLDHTARAGEEEEEEGEKRASFITP